jgi:PAS domain S-box-containing protein
MKIRSKIAVALIPLLLLSVVAMSAFSKQAAQEVLIQGVINSGRAISLNLAQSPEMLQSFQQGEEKRLLPLLQQVQENSGARYAMILSLTGEVRAHTNVVERGKLYADEATLQAVGSDQSEYLRLMLDGQELMDLSFPIWEVEKNEAGEEFILTGKKEARAQKRLGTIRLGLPLQEALDTAGRISSQVFWIITLVSLGAVGLGMLFMGRLLRPISLLGEAANRIGKGGMGVTVPVLADDELGELARSFNQMSQELAVTTVSKDFLDSILRNMQDLLVVTDAGGIISLVNQSTLELLSYREEDLVGQPAVALFSGGDQEFGGQNMALKVRELAGSREARMVTSAGAEVPVVLSLGLLAGQERSLEGFIITAADITERKEAEDQLRLSLQEKEVLLKEIHHRVKNNMQVISSLLDLQSAQITDPLIRAPFLDSQNRIKSMALIHERLYQSPDLARIDFTNYVQILVPRLFDSYQITGQQVSLKLEAAAISLEVSQAIPCGLIINELIANALKHAFREGRQGQLVLSMAQTAGDEEIVLVVADNGIGLPDEVMLGQANTLGLQLVQVLTKQLKGSITIDRSAGTRFELRFPWLR